MFYRIHTQDHGVVEASADSAAEAVLIVCRATGERTWNTAILDANEQRVAKPGDTEHEVLDECLADEMPASYDRECAEHDSGFSAEVFTGAR